MARSPASHLKVLSTHAQLGVPDGLSVMYRSDVGLSYGLFVKRANGSGPAKMLLDLDQEIHNGLWSSDGQWLLFRTNAPQDVYAIRPGIDSIPVPLLNEEFNETAPALSPNGKWLAYVSDESGRSEVYVRSFPNVADTKRQVSTDGGVEPVWAHSGQELFLQECGAGVGGCNRGNESDIHGGGESCVIHVPRGIQQLLWERNLQRFSR